MAKCKNCNKEFIKSRKKTNRHYKFCDSKCYWEYHLKDIIRKEDNNVKSK